MKRYVILKDDLEIEQDSIIDTQTNTLYECRSSDMNKLCKLLNEQDTKWQKLEKWLNKEADHVRYTPYDCRSLSSDFELWHLNKILDKMQELEGEDV